MPLPFHQKRGAIERGWGQVGSSHLNEKFTFEQDATVVLQMLTVQLNYIKGNRWLSNFGTFIKKGRQLYLLCIVQFSLFPIATVTTQGRSVLDNDICRPHVFELSRLSLLPHVEGTTYTQQPVVGGGKLMHHLQQARGELFINSSQGSSQQLIQGGEKLRILSEVDGYLLTLQLCALRGVQLEFCFDLIVASEKCMVRWLVCLFVRHTF